LNKYYPPDFDPAALPRLRRPKNFQYKVRLMAPFSMRCNTCGEWIAKGKKFNASKEDSTGESYLGIQIYRFYIRCPRCSSEIAFKTDPEHTDYICEVGASRNFEPWREQALQIEESKKEKEEEEENNPMKALENRTDASRREIQILDALDEIRTLNAYKEKVDVNDVIGEIRSELEDPDALDDESLVKAIFSEKSNYVRRLEDEDEDEGENGEKGDKETFFARKRSPSVEKEVFFTKKRSNPEDQGEKKEESVVKKSKLGIMIKKKEPGKEKEKEPVKEKEPEKEKEKEKPKNALASLVSYGDDEDDD